MRVDTEIAERTKRAGVVVVGLAWTPAGGDILFIEANKMKGKGGFNITGQIGDVMKESMQAALTWVRSNAMELGLDEDFTKDVDIHIHVPAGAIPKDGPSAGVTMATALVSLLTGKQVRPLTAMTGEITLSGDVLPVGGIKEKFLAAKRAGVRDVIMPIDCKQQVDEDLTPEQTEGINIHYARRIEDVLSVALPKDAIEEEEDQEVREEVAERGGVERVPPTPCFRAKYSNEGNLVSDYVARKLGRFISGAPPAWGAPSSVDPDAPKANAAWMRRLHSEGSGG